jgi:hypothetical protein
VKGRNMTNNLSEIEILSCASLSELFGEPIDAYTRAQAIEDGALIDVTDTAKEAGFTVPVAITAAVWADCVEWTQKDSARQTYQHEGARLADVLRTASHAARRHGGKSEIYFQFYRVQRGGRDHIAKLVMLALKIAFGDQLEPVITVMQPHED